MLTDDLFCLVAVNARCSGIPADNPSVSIEQEKRIVLHPGRIFTGPRPARCGSFLDLSRRPGRDALAGRFPWPCTQPLARFPSGTYQPERAPLFALFQKGPPELLRSEA